MKNKLPMPYQKIDLRYELNPRQIKILQKPLGNLQKLIVLMQKLLLLFAEKIQTTENVCCDEIKKIS